MFYPRSGLSDTSAVSGHLAAGDARHRGGGYQQAQGTRGTAHGTKVEQPSACRAVALAKGGGCLSMAGTVAGPTFNKSRPDT